MEQKNNNKSIVYAIVGILTLIVAVTGATFAYFTATASNNTVIKGNMATIAFNLTVTKVTHVDETKGGMIPMSNTMVEHAAAGTDTNNDSIKETCVDNNGNAVCQIYKIVVDNQGSGSSLFLDGYVTLTGGSGTPTDAGSTATNKTTMRWAQVFCSGTQTDEITGCTTGGSTTTGASGISWDAISNPGGHANDNIKLKANYSSIISDGTINSSTWKIINTNYIRISDHAAGATYKREDDVSSALVYNQYLAEKDATGDSATLYIVVWLSETGYDQTATSTGVGTPANSGLGFFGGNVTFLSSEGNEVTATFQGYTRKARTD